jgi:hypothetical protein
MYEGGEDIEAVRLVLQEAGHVEYGLKAGFQSR